MIRVVQNCVISFSRFYCVKYGVVFQFHPARTPAPAAIDCDMCSQTEYVISLEILTCWLNFMLTTRAAFLRKSHTRKRERERNQRKRRALLPFGGTWPDTTDLLNFIRIFLCSALTSGLHTIYEYIFGCCRSPSKYYRGCTQKSAMGYSFFPQIRERLFIFFSSVPFCILGLGHQSWKAKGYFPFFLTGRRVFLRGNIFFQTK